MNRPNENMKENLYGRNPQEVYNQPHLIGPEAIASQFQEKNIGVMSNANASATHRKNNKSDPPTLKSFNTSTLSSLGGALRQITISSLAYIAEFLKIKLEEEFQFIQSNPKAIDALQTTINITNPRLVTLKYISNFQCFCIVNKKIHSNFYKAEQILKRLESLNNILKSVIAQLKSENQSRVLTFFEEAECYKCFLKLFGQDLMSQDYFRKFASEIWKLIRDLPRPSELNERSLAPTYERIYLFIYGISLPSSNADDYPLHKAIFDSNLPLIRKLCTGSTSSNFYCNIEQADPSGLTPLMLAVKLNRKDIVLILADHGADPKHRCIPYSRTPLEEAISNKQKAILRILLVMNHHQTVMRWDNSKAEIMDILEKTPDFSFDINWECDSKYIPFVKKLTPSDTYKIHKKGSSLRMDMTLLGWNKLKLLRGNVSIVLQGRGSGKHEGQLLMIDNIQRTVSNLLTDINLKRLDSELERLIKQEPYSSEVKSENIHFDPAKSWKGDVIVQKIENYTAIKHNARGTFSLMYTKKNSNLNMDLTKVQGFMEYFAMCLQNQVWTAAEDPLKGSFLATQVESIVDSMNCDQELIANLFGKEMAAKQKDKAAQKPKLKEQINAAEKKILKQYKKNVVASVWVCDQFPLNFDHLLPILDILSSASPYISQIRDFLERNSLLKKSSFPLKAIIPLYYSVNAIICFKNFNFSSPSLSLFNVEKMKTAQVELAVENSVMSADPEEYLDSNSHPSKEWPEYANPNGAREYTPVKNQGVLRCHANDESDDSPESFYRNNRDIQSFFKKRVKASIANQDYFNIFEEEQRQVDVEDFNCIDLSEKFRDETLKVSSHQLQMPKSISSLEGKYTFAGRNATDLGDIPTDSNLMTITNQQKGLKEQIIKHKQLLQNPITMKPLAHGNQLMVREEQKNYNGSIAESCNANVSFDLSSGVGVGQQQMRKLQKYNLKKHTLLSKGSFPNMLGNIRETNENLYQTYDDSEQENVPTECSIEKEEPRKLVTKRFSKHHRMRSTENQ